MQTENGEQARFDSRDRFYKSKPGAVRAEESVRFRLSLPGGAGYGDVLFVLRAGGEQTAEYRHMHKSGEAGGRALFELDVAFCAVGLYWYHFEYDSEWTRHYVYRGAYNRDQSEGGDWQQTVYDPGYRTPGWVPGGVIYQIFPDRFYNSGKEKRDVPADRAVRGDWGGQPAYLQTGPQPTLGHDYFGGDLRGVTEKLHYLRSLGVTAVYLNPIFEAHSNHRYDTADYLRVDPMLGDEADLRELCEAARGLGMRVILDGVFSHTGADSRYFNRFGRYEGPGAYQSQASPYYEWYRFGHWPERYAAWWGVPSLPEVDEENPSYLEFIAGPGGVLRKWLKAGASGWRLDVADELPDGFLCRLRAAVKEENPDAVILGEVWEDASNKISYGGRRRFLLGKQLDGVMNYPLAEGIVRFLRGGPAQDLAETILALLEHYPLPAVSCMMNHIGTHDTPRALTALGGEPAGDRGREWQAARALTAREYEDARTLLYLASVLQYTLPGVPSLYYGDEAGLTGYGDPFNRGCFPWGHEDPAITAHYRMLGRMRAVYDVFADGGFELLAARDGCIAYQRAKSGKKLLAAVNAGDLPCELALSDCWRIQETVAGQPPGGESLRLPGRGFSILYCEEA